MARRRSFSRAFSNNTVNSGNNGNGTNTANNTNVANGSNNITGTNNTNDTTSFIEDIERPVVNQPGNNSANRPNRRTNGIVDTTMFSNNICILATRVFDGVRMDLDDEEAELVLDTTTVTSVQSTQENCVDDITILCARSNSNVADIQDIKISPFDCVYSVVRCTILAPGEASILQNGTRSTVPCHLVIPFSALMQLPEDSVLPFDITAQCNFLASDSTQICDNRFMVEADAVVIVLVTGQLPVYVPYISQFGPASILQRQFDETNSLLTIPVFPSRNPSVPNSPPNSCGLGGSSNLNDIENF